MSEWDLSAARRELSVALRDMQQAVDDLRQVHADARTWAEREKLAGLRGLAGESEASGSPRCPHATALKQAMNRIATAAERVCIVRATICVHGGAPVAESAP